jgi:hypothetical protein
MRQTARLATGHQQQEQDVPQVVQPIVISYRLPLNLILNAGAPVDLSQLVATGGGPCAARYSSGYFSTWRDYVDTFRTRYIPLSGYSGRWGSPSGGISA